MALCRFNQRSLYYVVRELVPGLEDGYFGALVTEFENEHGEIAGMFRNNRGAFYEPHSDEVRPLGTLTVREYTRSAMGLWLGVGLRERRQRAHAPRVRLRGTLGLLSGLKQSDSPPAH